MQKKLLAGAIAALGFAAFPVMSQEHIFTEIDAPPPAMKSQATPAARAGYVYAPGYWDYQDRKYTWTEGRFMPERKGYVYMAPRYEERDGRWRKYGERWVTPAELVGTTTGVDGKLEKPTS